MQDQQAQNEMMTAEAPLRFGLTALILGNLALSIGPWLVREAGTGPVASAFWRLAIATPLIFLLARRFAGPIIIPKPVTLAVLVVAGILFAADLAAWHVGIFYTKLANANLLGNSTSFLLPLWVFVTTRTWPSGKQSIALGLAGIGAILLMGRSFELSPDNLFGDFLCILAGVFYTAYLIMMAKARGNVGLWPSLAWVTLAATLLLLLVAIWANEILIPQQWSAVVTYALLSQVIGQGLMIYAIGRVSALTFGLVLMIQPAASAAIGWMVYNEALSSLDLIGAVFIGLALILVSQPDK